MLYLTLLAFTAAIGLSQPAERVFAFTQLRTPAQIAETATLIRSIGEIRDLTTDAAPRTMNVRGDPAQAALAEWLFSKLDRDAAGGATADITPLDYRPETGGDDLVRVFYFQAPMPHADVNELATVIRSILDLRHAFVSNAAGAFAVRGTQERMDAAKWLFDALQQRGGTSYRINDAAGHNTIRVFALAETVSKPELQSMAAEVRMTTLIKRIYGYYPRRAIAMRGTYAQTEQAAGLIGKR